MKTNCILGLQLYQIHVYISWFFNICNIANAQCLVTFLLHILKVAMSYIV